ncbi:MAG: hypothetical protein L0312_15990, partial [Acidobacteria bacterium]|nr:hypothetical protein [Acidobacteriota bacterium]
GSGNPQGNTGFPRYRPPGYPSGNIKAFYQTHKKYKFSWQGQFQLKSHLSFSRIKPLEPFELASPGNDNQRSPEPSELSSPKQIHQPGQCRPGNGASGLKILQARG